jgi:hypothetical protein
MLLSCRGDGYSVGRLGRASIAVKSMALSVPPLVCVVSLYDSLMRQEFRGTERIE